MKIPSQNPYNYINRYHNFGKQTVSTPVQNQNAQPSINSNPDTQNLSPNGSSGAKTSILYINDIHGKMTNMERIYSISKQFDRNTGKDVDSLKLSSGDVILGANFELNRVANRFLNWVGVSANTLGNHEMDVEPDKLSLLLNKANYKLLAINASVDEGSPMYGKIGKSIIEERNGHKYGIIGIAPSDMKERVKLNESVKDIKIDDFDVTMKKVQDEINNLKSQGINKIIILSHSGLDNDKKLATQTTGIDLILGGHTHNLLDGIKEGVNLLYSKSGEPVIITQAGKDGEHVGILNVEFTEDGVVKKAQNNLIKTRAFNRTLTARAGVADILGKSEIITKVSKSVPPPDNRLIINNPHGNVIVDAMRSELGTEIALLNAGNIRGHFDVGPVDTRLITDISPFADKMLIINISEKQLVDAIKVGCSSFKTTTNKPGILLVSGLRYVVTDKGELKKLSYVDKEGKETEINIDNPSTEKKFLCAADDFFATGGDNYMPTNEHPDFIVKKFDIDKNELAISYLRKQKSPIEIKEDDRIQIVKS